MLTQKLLSRDAFRHGVLERDHHACVFCENQDVDAHHILDRRLWDDGGYYLDNGASVCAVHHRLCETTEISVEQVRAAARILNPILPGHLYAEQKYDKWGNVALPNGNRLKGELFFELDTQTSLAEGKALGLFDVHVKYPRTPHLQWSEGVNDDDRVIASMKFFERKRVIVTEKMDGENSSLYSTAHGTHARSLDGRSHPSRDWLKQFWSGFSNDIPDGWRICVENMFAKHSIRYENLPSYCLGFSVWNDRNVCLPWDDTLEWLALLGIIPVRTIYDGIYDENAIRALWDATKSENVEGYVVRTAEAIAYADFRNKIAKFVRKNHVQTNNHWMHGQIISKNGLQSQR